jgi:hypothetical protein
MVEKAGSPFRSANAGELSPEAAGRVDIKQFYSAGLRYKNMEPDMAGSFDNGRVRGSVAVVAQSGVSVTPAAAVIYQANVLGVVVAIDCTALDTSVGEHVVQAQVFNGSVWKNIGGSVDVGTAARAVTMAAAPGEGVLVSAVRLLATFSVAASITTGVVTVLTETALQDAPRYSSVRHDSGSRYFLCNPCSWMCMKMTHLWLVFTCQQ